MIEIGPKDYRQLAREVDTALESANLPVKRVKIRLGAGPQRILP